MTRLLFCALALLLAGCPGRHARPDDFVDDPAVLLAGLDAHARAVQSLTAELALEVWRDDERVRLKQLVAVRQPSSLRIDSLSPFGQPVSTLVSDGLTLSLYDLEQKRFLRGAASPANLARLVPVPMEPGELGALLRGTVPVIEHTSAAVDWDAEKGRYRVDLSGTQRRQTVWFEPAQRRVTRTRVTVDDEILYTARLGDYSGGATPMPRRIRVEVPAESLRIDIGVESHRLNPELPDEAFHLDAPRGIPVEPF